MGGQTPFQLQPTSDLELDALRDIKLHMQQIQQDISMVNNAIDRILIPKLIEARWEPNDGMAQRIAAKVWERGVDNYLAKMGSSAEPARWCPTKWRLTGVREVVGVCGRAPFLREEPGILRLRAGSSMGRRSRVGKAISLSTRRVGAVSEYN